jgi:hypothetical protein
MCRLLKIDSKFRLRWSFDCRIGTRAEKIETCMDSALPPPQRLTAATMAPAQVLIAGVQWKVVYKEKSGLKGVMREQQV